MWFTLIEMNEAHKLANFFKIQTVRSLVFYMATNGPASSNSLLPGVLYGN